MGPDSERQNPAFEDDFTTAYWVMTGDDFTLDLNNPEHPKILCVGNNPDRQNIYSAALGLYNQPHCEIGKQERGNSRVPSS